MLLAVLLEVIAVNNSSSSTGALQTSCVHPQLHIRTLSMNQFVTVFSIVQCTNEHFFLKELKISCILFVIPAC